MSNTTKYFQNFNFVSLVQRAISFAINSESKFEKSRSWLGGEILQEHCATFILIG